MRTFSRTSNHRVRMILFNIHWTSDPMIDIWKKFFDFRFGSMISDRDESVFFSSDLMEWKDIYSSLTMETYRSSLLISNSNFIQPSINFSFASCSTNDETPWEWMKRTYQIDNVKRIAHILISNCWQVKFLFDHFTWICLKYPSDQSKHFFPLRFIEKSHEGKCTSFRSDQWKVNSITWPDRSSHMDDERARLLLRSVVFILKIDRYWLNELW